MSNDLAAMLNPHARWDNETDLDGNAKAYKTLKDFLGKLKNCKLDKKYLPGRGDIHTSYYLTLFAVKKALSSNYYMRACHEIITLFHFEHSKQGRICNNVIHLLEQYLEV